MSKTIAQQVSHWFAAHCDELSDSFKDVRFRLVDSEDQVHGKVNLELSRPNLAASITFWNKGDVTALRLNTSSRKEEILDDRKLLTDDKIDSLLDNYIEKLHT